MFLCDHVFVLVSLSGSTHHVTSTDAMYYVCNSKAWHAWWILHKQTKAFDVQLLDISLRTAQVQSLEECQDLLLFGGRQG